MSDELPNLILVRLGLIHTQNNRILEQLDRLVDDVPSLKVLICAPISLHSEVESAVAVTPIVTVFLGSVERCFSVPAAPPDAVARSLGQAWRQATGAAGAQRA